jgi:uncharacterized protein (DUF1015 family)
MILPVGPHLAQDVVKDYVLSRSDRRGLSEEFAMPEIQPFRAVRYDSTRTGGDVSNLIAPPYDVLGQGDKDALLSKSARNIVAVDLPHIPPKSLGPQEAYDRSAETLKAWLADGTLVREKKPALYVYHQTFEHAGKTYIQRKFITAVRLRPFEEGVILPHEETFGGPKEDRLALMKATACNLSPVFALYTDPEDVIGEAFASIVQGEPDVVGTMGGVANKVWIVTELQVIGTVVSAMAPKKLYIADGHHRYGTALNYRNWLREQEGGVLPEDHPANFVMLVLGSMDDSGSLILPYHRALGNVELATVLDAWSAGTEPAPVGQEDVVLYDGATGAEKRLRYTDRGKLRSLEPGQCPSWYRLDAAYLHRYLIDELLRARAGREPRVRYVKSAEDARQVAKDEAGVALLVNATPMEHLRAVSEEGGLMPQKSTYFYPKLATGLTINPLTA